MLSLTSLAGQIGETDCETIGDGLLAQPSNAISSAAYVVAGVWLILWMARRNSKERAVGIAYGAALAATGFGSIAFHGPMPAGARILHDLTIAAVFAVLAARAVGLLRHWTNGKILGVAAALIILIGLVMAVSPEVGIALSGIVGVAAMGLEVSFYRTGRRPALSRRQRSWLIAAIAVLAVAGLANVLGRTDAPLCEPDSIFQGHALWHLMTAAAFGIFGWISFGGHQADDV